MLNNVFSNQIVGHQIIKLNKVDSTNNYLKKLLSNSKPSKEGTVIMTDSQFAGRGQFNNYWISETGKNLTFSIHLQPNFISTKQQFILNKCICVSLFQSINLISAKTIKIKWPNDLYIDDVKIGGILIENIIRGGKITDSVIGIGINVNQENFIGELKNKASSLKILNNKHFELTPILESVLKSINHWYEKLKTGEFHIIENAYKTCLKNYNENIKFIEQDEKKSGILCGVDEEGKLLINYNNKLHSYRHLEIKIL